MNVYFKTDAGVVDTIEVKLKPGEDHVDAILTVCDHLVSTGEGYNKPVLAVINGGN